VDKNLQSIQGGKKTLKSITFQLVSNIRSAVQTNKRQKRTREEKICRATLRKKEGWGGTE